MHGAARGQYDLVVANGQQAKMDAQVVRWIEESHLDLHEARAMLALSETGRPMTAGEIADLAGLDLDSAHKAVNSLHGRRLTEENRRRHALTRRGCALMRPLATPAH
jgi:DNA-binding MarR family transcriptional regulator